jgi:hypothetical protein
MTTTHEVRRYAKQVIPTSRLCQWRSASQRFVLILILTSLCSLTLTGCKDFWDTTADLLRIDGEEAEAQDQTEVRIKTYVINPEGFEVVLDTETDATPTHLVSDSATELTMQSSGSLVRGNGDPNIALEQGDILILRIDGTTGTVTLIRQD